MNKGGSGTVFIPLQPDDPLYVEGSNTNFMVLTRATVSAGPDGDHRESADDVGPVNTTTSYVDQNQTYTSHPSHQVFLRQYVLNAAGDPVATGKLIEGANGGMATWGEVKAQARSMLGIDLTDNDVGSVPLLRTDAYGNFIPGANGFRSSSPASAPTAFPTRATTSSSRAISSRRSRRRPPCARPCLPRRHRPRSRAGRQDSRW